MRADYDLVVVGAGAGGMTAALVAANEGLKTLLIENSDRVGGTTARSSGTVWIPDNPHQRALGVGGDAGAALSYLEALAAGRGDPALRRAFVAAGGEMIGYLEAHTEVRFRAYPEQPDYRQDLPGAAAGGRPLEPLPFDGRILGAAFARLRWPLPELMLAGGMMVTRGEAGRLLRAWKSWDGLQLGIRLAARYGRDRLSHERGTRLVLGNALAARLYKGLIDRGVDIWFEAGVSRLTLEAGRVTGLDVSRGGVVSGVRARRGVVLAGGGFPASAAWRGRYLPEPAAQYTAAFEGCVGDTLALAQAVGAALGPEGEDNALWFPSSIARRRDGRTAVYPHIVLDRPKPGLIAVDAAGRRFVNEAASYHEFCRAMIRAHRRQPCIPAFLVCDRKFLWKYGLGLVRPLTLRLRPHLDGGYLKTANTLAALARKLGVDAAGLEQTVSAHNGYAKTGVDAEFGKGGNRYDRANGDPEHAPNPCLGAIAAPPYYAVAVLPTPLGTSLGLATDASARVLDGDGDPIAGLYACGNDMHSIVAGEYPGAGAQLGPALTFGYLAARHAAAVSPA
ncbi:MAG TPA: FAD-dependent oxidoreductase [Rhodocyclaceae bacterium]|nr:FAD-dependent oxidoreductase [Rhodocyclaceae bacterium]